MWAWNARCHTSHTRRPNTQRHTQSRSIVTGRPSLRPNTEPITNGRRPSLRHSSHNPVHSANQPPTNVPAAIFGVECTGHDT